MDSDGGLNFRIKELQQLIKDEENIRLKLQVVFKILNQNKIKLNHSNYNLDITNSL